MAAEWLLAGLAIVAAAFAGWRFGLLDSTRSARAQQPEAVALVLASADALLALDRRGKIVHASPLAAGWFTHGSTPLAGTAIDRLFERSSAAAIAAVVQDAWKLPGSIGTLDAVARPGVAAPAALELSVVRTGRNESLLIVHLRDVAQRRQALVELQRDRTILQSVFDAVPMALFTKDLEGHYVRANRANLQRFGLTSEAELRGKTIHDVSPAEYARLSDEHDRLTLASGELQYDVERTGLTGPEDKRWFQTIRVPLRDPGGAVIGLLGITSEVTERKEVERKLADQAAHDALTGLPNRRSLLERLTRVMETARHQRESLAVIFCDLDFFKTINDMHGHEFGDQVLRALAQSIVARLRPDDWIARFGGDEFVIVCYPIAGEIEGYRIATELLNAVRAPLLVQGASIRIDASIGIAFMRAEHRASELIRDADAAMYMAKEQGRNRVAMFDDRLRKKAVHRSSLDQALRTAVENEELSLVYQPKVSLHDGRLVGFEALLRWNNEQHGFVSPASFIPLAEESGSILAIGRWALEQACLQLRAWQQSFPAYDDLTLAVNVSMRQLFQEGFLQMAREIVDDAGIYPHALELEITESTAMSNPQQTAEVLAQLKGIGLRIALDDFGTGYSSLAHLQKLPIDVIKIDRAFVHGIADSKENSEIARLVIAMARALGITSVAEGLERREDLGPIKALGADIAQGYLFSKPITAAEADALLQMGTNFMVD
ncbi:hypothetical protein BH10PSE17_BH10PSE17_29320 [soil metagenome]